MITDNGKDVYTLRGVSKDIESISRSRSWMEDEVSDKGYVFSYTKLYTDYVLATETLEFKIVFYE